MKSEKYIAFGPSLPTWNTRWCDPCLSLILFLSISLNLHAQPNIPIGTWRTHFSYNNTLHLTLSPNRVYAAAENGLYYFDKTDNRLAKISKIDGLQSSDISTLGYDDTRNQLLIGYASGNMDIIRGDEIVNLDLTTSSQVAGSKTINHFTVTGSFAYVATDFGLLKFDLKKLEVKETYREIGSVANPVQVSQGVVYNDSIFLATEEGVIAANIVESGNLLDYQNWRRFGAADGLQEAPVQIISAVGDKLIAGLSTDGLYSYDGTEWIKETILTGENFKAACGVMLITDAAVWEVSPTMNLLPIVDVLLTQPNAALKDVTGHYWVADGVQGLLSNQSGDFGTYTPSGPGTDVVAGLYYHKKNLYTLPGNPEERYATFQFGIWNDITLPASQNTVLTARYPLNVTTVYAQTWTWISSGEGGGVDVYDSGTGSTRHLTNITGNGGLPDKTVHTITLDKEGFVWVGTDKGVAVFTDPLNLMQGDVNAVIPVFENAPLLRNEKVTAIKIDAGNRKWIGTGNGVWLFDENTTTQRHYFNTDNSPLPHNSIIAIEINEVTGEVFFATPAGIASYRDGATEALATHTNVKIFPNPVSPDFTGTVGISGLAEAAVVKITDISGKLVWETRANGGTATWQMRDIDGRRVATGVYLVFSATSDGESTYVGKIAILN